MVLVMAVHFWRSYLLGEGSCLLPITNLRSVCYKQWINTPDQQHWLAKLLGYDLEIRYRAGKSNVAAHAMSCKDEEGKLLSISMPMWVEWEELGAAIRAYLYLQNIILKLQAGKTEILHFSLINSLLFYDDKLVTPKVSPWVTKLLEEFHVSPMGRHSRAFRTLKKMASTFIWQGMRGDVYRFVATCVMSQHQSTQRLLR